MAISLQILLKGQRGERGRTGDGFSLTADSHFNIKNKGLTNVSAPVDDGDAMTKRFVTDLLKGKAGTIYVKNELTKKLNKSILGDYVLKSDSTSAAHQPFLFIIRTTHLTKVSVRFSTALSDQINHPPHENGGINSNYWSLVNNELEIKKIGIYKLEYTDLIDGNRIDIIHSSTDGSTIWRQIESCSIRGNRFTQINIVRVISITGANTLMRISLDNEFFSGSGFGSLFIQNIAP